MSFNNSHGFPPFVQVLSSSGRGWQLFAVRTVGAVGQLYATKPLDYENETHRRGFRFTVQVTDGVSVAGRSGGLGVVGVWLVGCHAAPSIKLS